MTEPKERPIIFSGEMVRAILEGRKTQTRRVIKPPLVAVDDMGTEVWVWQPNPEAMFISLDYADWPQPIIRHCPYGQVGDRLWVREAWRTEKNIDHMSAAQMVDACLDAGYRSPWAPIGYEADKRFDNWDQGQEVGRLRPSIHMPRWASRIDRTILKVRAERVQDITDADILAEGITVDRVAEWTGTPWVDMPELRDAWRVWWNHLNAARGFPFEADSWVWVIEYPRWGTA